MKQVVMTRPLRPWQAGDTPVFPDVVADKAIADGDAVAYEPRPGDVVFPADKPAARPLTSYLTRRKGPAA